MAVDRGTPCIAFLGADGAIDGKVGDTEGLDVVGGRRKAKVPIARTMDAVKKFLTETTR